MANNATDKDLISRVQASAQKLKIAAAWSHGPSLKVADSFLLELYLLFMTIEELQKTYDVEYDPGTHPNQHVFPQSGAQKRTRPKFLVKDKISKQTICQICPERVSRTWTATSVQSISPFKPLHLRIRQRCNTCFKFLMPSIEKAIRIGLLRMSSLSLPDG